MKKYLEYYKECLETGKLKEKNGLCHELDLRYTYFFKLIKPSEKEKNKLIDEGLCYVYWGSGLNLTASLRRKAEEFTPLRQNLILLMAALNNEL